MQRFLDCDRQQAVNVVNELINARLRRFQHIAAVELPVLFEEFKLDLDARRKLLRYVQALQDWMAGDYRWHRETRRYTHIPSRIPGGPRGLGTSAAQIVSVRSGHAAL